MKESTLKKQAFYIDTNISLDYITGRNPETIFVLNSLVEMDSIVVSSSFLVMEAADFEKESLYFIEKVMNKKWELRKAVRESYRKDLKRGDFYKVQDWIEELRDKLKLQLYDFLINSDTWEIAQYISQNSNLFAPDVIHLSSSIIAAQSGIKIDKGIKLPCEIFISNDDFLKKEAKKIKEELEISYPEILTVSEIKHNLLKANQIKSGEIVRQRRRYR